MLFQFDEQVVKRFSIVLILSITVLTLIGYKLFDYQVANAETLLEQADSKRETGSTLHGKRGTIYDRNGAVLAQSVTRYHLTVAPKHVKDYRKAGETFTVAQVAEKIVDTTNVGYEETVHVLTSNPDSLHEYVAKFLTFEQITEINTMGAPWLYSEQVEVRNYPNGTVAASLVGFVGTDEALAGVELLENSCLQGDDGYQVYGRSADGVRVPGSTTIVEPQKIGDDVRLTIDVDLQWFAQKVLEEEGSKLDADWAHTVIVDASTGEVLTAADWPTFDANSFDDYPSEVLGSKIFTTPYEPGSTIKSLSFALALEKGVVNVSDKLYIPSEYRINSDYRITDAFDHDTVQYTGAGVLAYSSNIGMSKIGEELTNEEVYGTYKKFGLDEKTSINFVGESEGSIFTPDKVDIITKRTQLFGQGMTATAIQLAGAYQVLANSGVKHDLTLVSETCGSENTPNVGTKMISETTADSIVEILEEVVNEGVLKYSTYTEGYQIAGKTGTAEVATIDGYGDEKITSIAGMLPHADRNYVILTTFGNPKTNRVSSGVGPAYNKIVKYMINKYDIKPSEDTVNLPLKW